MHVTDRGLADCGCGAKLNCDPFSVQNELTNDVCISIDNWPSLISRPMKPIIPIIRQEPFDDSAWLFELKLDGFRGIANTVRGRMLSKNGHRLRRFEPLLDRVCEDNLKIIQWIRSLWRWSGQR